MSATVNISSSAQWRQLLGSSSVVIADFYADWCGPCKMIAPTFESLSTKYSKPKKITFCKVDTDRQQEIARMYSVRSMPTFILLHNGSVIKTVSGANPPALAAAVERAIKLAGSAAPGAGFASQGRTLGGSGLAGGRSAPGLGRPLKWDLNNFINAVIIFIGLYLVSLLSIDAYKAAENSRYNIKNPVGPAAKQQGAGNTAQKQAPKSTFKTLSDLGAE